MLQYANLPEVTLVCFHSWLFEVVIVGHNPTLKLEELTINIVWYLYLGLFMVRCIYVCIK